MCQKTRIDGRPGRCRSNSTPRSRMIAARRSGSTFASAWFFARVNLIDLEIRRSSRGWMASPDRISAICSGEGPGLTRPTQCST